MGRVHEQSVGWLRVDDESVSKVVLSDREQAIDCERRRGEPNHTLLPHTSDETNILTTVTGDARGAQGVATVELDDVGRTTEQGGGGVLAVGSSERRRKNIAHGDNMQAFGQGYTVGNERYHRRGGGGE
jgi:hypothetical protein